MKNLPSFQEFSKYDSLLESASNEQIASLMELNTSLGERQVNEGKVLDLIKNNLSKFFLGKYSKLSVIDDARKVLIQLEIELIEKRNEFEESVDKIEAQIDELRSTGDKQRMSSLMKDRENKIKEFENYQKTTRLKIRKAQEVVKDVIDGNPRRRKYYEAGRSEDEISIAELEYEMAKKKADQSEINKFESKLQKAKKEAADKAEELKAEMQTKGKEEVEKKEKREEKIKLLRMDPEAEKKKITRRRGKDIIERKRQLENSIVDLRADLERKLNMIQKRLDSGKKISKSYLDNKKMEFLSMAATIDAQKNLLAILREIGKTETEINKKLSDEKNITEITNRINQGIADGQDANSGLKKVISSIFVGPEGTINVAKIKTAKEKLNK